MHLVRPTLLLGLALANGAAGAETTIVARSLGHLIDFEGKPRLSPIAQLEFEFHLLYDKPVTSNDVEHVSFGLGELRFEQTPVSAVFEGHEYLHGEPIGSRFSLHTGLIELSLRDGDRLLADIEDDNRVAWAIFDPPAPVGATLVLEAVRLTGLEGVPDKDGEPTHAPEPSALLLWAGGLLAFAPWNRRRQT